MVCSLSNRLASMLASLLEVTMTKQVIDSTHGLDSLSFAINILHSAANSGVSAEASTALHSAALYLSNARHHAFNRSLYGSSVAYI